MHLTSQLHFTISMMGMHFLPSFPTLQFSVECAVLLLVLVLGMGQHVMPIGPLKPHANDGLDWRFFYFYIFYFHFLQKHIFDLEIYRNIPGRPDAGRPGPGRPAAGRQGFLRKKKHKK